MKKRAHFLGITLGAGLFGVPVFAMYSGKEAAASGCDAPVSSAAEAGAEGVSKLRRVQQALGLVVQVDSSAPVLGIKRSPRVPNLPSLLVPASGNQAAERCQKNKRVRDGGDGYVAKEQDPETPHSPHEQGASVWDSVPRCLSELVANCLSYVSSEPVKSRKIVADSDARTSLAASADNVPSGQ